MTCKYVCKVCYNFNHTKGLYQARRWATSNDICRCNDNFEKSKTCSITVSPREENK